MQLNEVEERYFDFKVRNKCCSRAVASGWATNMLKIGTYVLIFAKAESNYKKICFILVLLKRKEENMLKVHYELQPILANVCQEKPNN